MQDLLRRKLTCDYACTIFHHFPIISGLGLVKCRQFSVLGLPEEAWEAFILPR
jgi:hypothetical protein